MDYTEAQRQAIGTLDGNLQIIACAGSGKTRVVAARVVSILLEKGSEGITPENVVAFTFTEKAAAELKDRITRMYQEAFGHVEGLAGMYVGTIHGFCLDLLQRYVDEYLKYDILDEIKQRLLVDRNYVKSGMKGLGLKRWVESKLYLTILGLVRETDADAGLLQNHPVRAALEQYQDLLDGHRYLDYDEMLVQAVRVLITVPQVREQVRQRVKYLTVDEYQDVNPIQEALIRELHDLGANLCVVGDDDQNVYEWRGSDVRHIVDFANRYPGVTQVPLELNFRSTPAVVDVARRVVEPNQQRLPKVMRSHGTRPFERGDLLCQAFIDPTAEAAWVAQKVTAMRGMPYQEADGTTRGLSWSDCAILLRSVRGSAAPFVQALRAAGVPHIVAGMTGLFDTPEVQAAVAIFQFMTREIDEVQVKQVWQAAAVGLTDADLERGLTLLREGRTFEKGKRFSVYNLQRTFLGFLEEVRLREERVPGGRGEVVYYNLGKFSQVISDFEEIHFKSDPQQKYEGFVGFLRHQAPSYYPEGGQDVAYATPDAVRIMTVHQAKGMEYPVVFLPCLQRNRFPAKKQFNRVWSHVPRAAIKNADRYDTDIEDERRLFYVALTRSEKYLFCSWAPDPGNQLYRRPSEFWDELTHRQQFLTKEPPATTVAKLAPVPRRPLVNVELSFSELKYFFECPYSFKLRFLYGFNPPLVEKLGYGRSLHNTLAEIHRRALAGDEVDEGDVPELVDRHLQVRYAFPTLEADLRTSAEKAIETYVREHKDELSRLEHAEETVELTLPDGIVVNGRIDLIKRTDTGEVVVVDFKSVERAQVEEVTRAQLHVYALGYEERFGRPADLIEVHNLDQGGSLREVVNPALTDETVAEIRRAGNRLRENRLDRLGVWCETCSRCDMAGVCRTKPAMAKA